MRSRRVVFLLALAVSWFAALAVRLYQLQVLEHPTYRERAARQQHSVVTVTAPRGTIYDRHGHELAVSVRVESVAADPGQIDDPEGAASVLAGLLDVDATELTARLASDRGFVWVRRKIDPQLARKVRERLDEEGLEGVFFVPESKRYYPLGRLAAQVLGWVGTDGEGLAGLEHLYEPVVAAEQTRRTVLRDARSGRVLRPQLAGPAPRPGEDIHLTLDATIQHIVESELERAVLSANARSGMAVVLDPDDGAVLAMASFPGFDPSRFDEFPEFNWRNRPVTDAWEPGSTFKMVTVAAALEAAAVRPEDAFDCEMGGITLGRTRINDHKPFGVLTVSEILAHSSNVGAIKIGQLAGRERFHGTIKAFGFGRPTGVDLPSESAGILRSFKKWSPLSPAYHAFGQGLSVTTLQLANAFAAIANGGRLLKPYVVAYRGRPGEPSTPVGARQVVGRPISPSSVDQIRAMLERVVANGTATHAQVHGFPAAGKTGTAEKAEPGGGYAPNRYVASFVGYAPKDDPVLVAAVVLDEPWPRYHGGDVPAPAFRAIAEKTLLYLGEVPDRPLPERWPREEAAPRPQRTASRRSVPPGTVPDFGGLSARQAVSASSRRGIALKLHGHGAVVAQTPDPGTPLEAAGHTVELWLGHPDRGRG